MGSELTTVTVKKDLGFTADTFVKILSHCIMKIKKETGHWELLVRTSLCHFMHKKIHNPFPLLFFGSHYFKRCKDEEWWKEEMKMPAFFLWIYGYRACQQQQWENSCHGCTVYLHSICAGSDWIASNDSLLQYRRWLNVLLVSVFVNANDFFFYFLYILFRTRANLLFKFLP